MEWEARKGMINHDNNRHLRLTFILFSNLLILNLYRGT